MKNCTQVPAGDINATTSQKIARDIMGNNFFGIEEASQHFGVNATKQQLAYLSEIRTPKGRIITEAEIRECKDTHILIADFGLSILGIRGIVKKRPNQTLFYSQNWYNKEVFAKNKCKVGWQLVRKEPIPRSNSKTWNDQQVLLSKGEETPTARIVVYTMIGHFLATGERLFENIYVRCVDLVSSGGRVYVGRFDPEGIIFFACYDENRFEDISLSGARKQ